MSDQPLYLLDASGYLFRAYHAIRQMTDSQGRSTNALFGFVRAIQSIIKTFDPQYMAAVFDGPNNKASRLEIFADYKANRSECPEDLRYQIDWARDFCRRMKIPILEQEGYEADDVIASSVRWARDAGMDVFICSSDKDLAQLVDDQVKILLTHKDNKVIDSVGVEEMYGVPPKLVGDLLAMAGDSSDNIPGLSGIGAKTAAKLLQEFGSLDQVLANADKVSGKKRQQVIRDEADMARLSRKLVALHTDLDVPHEPSGYTVGQEDLESLREFYRQYHFTSLLKDLGGDEQVEELTTAYTLITTVDQLSNLVDALIEEGKELAFDTETTGLRPLEAELVGVGIASAPGKAWYVPLNGDMDRDHLLDHLRRLFASDRLGFYAHNAKYDLHILANVEIEIARLSFDTMLASYLLNAHERHHSLDRLSLEMFGFVKTPTKDLIGTGKKAITMDQVPIQKVADYCCEDVDYTCRLEQVLRPQIKERGMEGLFYDLELPLLRVLLKMERAGIFLEVGALETMGVELEKQLDTLEKAIHQLAGEPFNIKSPKQIGQILFEKMGISPLKKTTTGYSTSADVLETLAVQHPIAQKILEFRALEKLRSSYVASLPGEVNSATHRIHCSFLQSVAATGRLACTDPNLQNIPVRTEMGRMIREAFRPQKSSASFLSADYSQIELRILAHLSGDRSLLDAFHHGEDIHRYTASLVFGVSQDEVTSEMRGAAKAVNFGVIYGQGPFGLSKQIGVSMGEAQEFIKKYFERYPDIRQYLDSCIESARKTGVARSMTGRERMIPEIESKNPAIRQAAERLAINTPLQGTAADLIKMAMLKVDSALDQSDLDATMILQIHDELLFEVTDEDIDPLRQLAKAEMEQVYSLKVPLVVDVGVGKNWRDCK